MSADHLDRPSPSMPACSGLACLVDSAGKIVWVNDLWQRDRQRYGDTTADLAVGADYFAACLTRPGGEAFLERLRALLAASIDFFEFEYSSQQPIGAPVARNLDEPARWFMARAQAFSFECSRCAFIRHDDVTVDRRAASVLRASEGRYRDLFDAAPDAVFLIGVDEHDTGRILDANQTAAAMHGYTRDELCRMKITQLDTPEDASQAQARIAKLRRDGQIAFTVRHVRRDGTVFPVDVTARLTSIGDRQCIVSFNRDATERERFVHALREQQLRLDLATRASQVGFWDWDLVGNRVYFSPEWKAQLGYEPHELPDEFETWRSRLHPEDVTRTMDALDSHLAGGTRHYVTEFRLRHRNGSHRWIYVRGEATRDADGKPTRMVGCHVDITARKVADAERAALDRRLEQLQRVDAIGTLAGGIAHDFNNILTIVSGNVELSLLDDKLPAHLREGLDEVSKAAERARALTRQILSFSRTQPPRQRPLEIADVIAESSRLLRAAVPSHIALRSSVDAGLPRVLADIEQLVQVLVNLGTNAWHAIGEARGHIDVRAVHGPEGSGVSIEVADDGCGMDLETKRRAFEPYFTTKNDESDEALRGTGLGLSVVRGIVERHGGRIECTSKPDAGTVMRIVLPAITEPEDTTNGPDSPADERRPARVLLLDDEPNLLSVWKRGLVRLGHSVTTCDTAEGAFRALELEPNFDLLLTDYDMPGMRGDVVVRKVRQRFPHLPIVVCSGYLTPTTVRQLVDVGASKVLFKPLLATELDEAVQQLLTEG